MKQSDFNKLFIDCLTRNEFEKSLLEEMTGSKKLSAMSALAVYREDYEARLTEGLKNTFRAVYSILGDDDFNRTAMAYLKTHPSTFSDLDEYGDSFPLFLQGNEICSDYPFLPQLAHFEWSFRDIFHSAEVPGLNALELQQTLPDDSQPLQLVSSACLLSYNYAIEKLYSLKDQNEDEEEEFNFSQEEYILMFKKNSFVKMHILSKNQWSLLKNFQTPSAFLTCLKTAPATMTPEETQELFQILGTEQILLKSR